MKWWGHDENLLNTTEFAQPALFAMEVALFRLLESWGIKPDYVMGTRGRVDRSARRRSPVAGERCGVGGARGGSCKPCAGGAMVAVQATEDEVLSLLGPTSASPQSTLHDRW
ncbi:acyl transferase domain protein [Mycobacterium xenopi 4042]|uniref:Acyl transferase domain protein n=1 Tax=Mycobacterium xenopi 4042 TaxID=1299334 RepID=X7YLY4_MYCXE|nr:acyl transferase domain protein [Mycobacterium xenopi 4042]